MTTATRRDPSKMTRTLTDNATTGGRLRLRGAIVACAAFVALALAGPLPGAGANSEEFGPGPAEGPALPGPTSFFAGSCELASTDAAVGSPPAIAPHCVDFGTVAPFVFPNSWQPPPAWRRSPLTGAGAHPDATAMQAFARQTTGELVELAGIHFGSGNVKNVVVDLPAGLVGNPDSVERCTTDDFASRPVMCSPASQIGVVEISLEGFVKIHQLLPVYNLDPRPGRAAELGIPYAGQIGNGRIHIVATARTEGDYGLRAVVRNIPTSIPLQIQSLTVWGVPWAESHDSFRVPVGWEPASAGIQCHPNYSIPFQEGFPGGPGPECTQPAPYNPAWGPIEPFYTNPTECDGSEPQTRMATDSWQDPTQWHSTYDPDLSDPEWEKASSAAPPLDGCEQVPFDPDLDARPTTDRADSPTGLDVDLTIPQNNDPPPALAGDPGVAGDPASGAPGHWRSEAGLATAHLKDAEVTLPEGLVVNPSSANGLAACSSEQIGLTTTSGAMPAPIRFDNDDPSDNQGRECPDASKIGTVEVQTPLLDEADWPTGEVYLAAPHDNPFDSLLALYIVIRSEERNFIAKLAGEVTPDPETGRLTATFANNPQLPFSRFSLDFRGGAHAPLVTPSTCGAYSTESRLASWAQPAGQVASTDTWQIVRGPGGDCAEDEGDLPHDPDFDAGTVEPIAGAESPFVVNLRREDGSQRFREVTITPPAGLTAKLAGIPYCPDSALDTAEDRDGRDEQADPSCPAASRVGSVVAGAGAGPDPYEAEGDAYLAGPYEGAPLSLALVTPAVAGPFDLGTVVIRTALHVNPVTAEITAVSDPIPQVLRGIPLNVKSASVSLDRSEFTRNPTSCQETQVGGELLSALGVSAGLEERFQLGECRRLGFKPKLHLRLFGRGVHRSANPRLRAVLIPRPGDANIARAAVKMPSTLLLDQDHIRTICTRAQFATDSCPQRAIYGHAAASTPLLDNPLRGPVYLRSSDNPLPDLVADLRGQIRVEVAGRTDSVRGALRNTFDIVPDAPVSRFVLLLQGGQKSLLVANSNLCRGAQRARVNMLAHNGRRSLTRQPINVSRCKQIRKAKQRAAKRKRARNRGARRGARRASVSSARQAGDRAPLVAAQGTG